MVPARPSAALPGAPVSSRPPGAAASGRRARRSGSAPEKQGRVRRDSPRCARRGRLKPAYRRGARTGYAGFSRPLRPSGRNDDRGRGCVPNLLEKIDALPCGMRTHAGQPLLVAFFHLRHDLIVCHRTPWQKLFQQLFDVRAAQERMHVFSA